MSELVDKLITRMAERAEGGGKKKTGIAAAFAAAKKFTKGQPKLRGVTNSVEFHRIMELPRRVLDFNTVEDVTHIFAKPGATMKLRPCQSAALIEAALTNGLFAPIAAGFGKTLLTLLLPTALDSKHAVVFLPSRVYPQLMREIDELYSKHFELPLDTITFVTYEQLSSPKNTYLLEQIQEKRPIDLFVCDEAHKFRHKSSTRTKRYFNFSREHPEVRHCHLSGTMSTRSITDYAHLIELCLRKMSPLPRGYHEVLEWAGALDVKPEMPVLPGVLRKLCNEDEDVRSGFRRRRNETMGVVATSENDPGMSLIIERLEIPVPASVKEKLDDVRVRWALDGDEFDSIMTKVRVLRQLACGFYYRWVWPGGEPDWDWLTARSNWHKAVREKLKHATTGMDSPLLLSQAADRWLQGKKDGRLWACQEWAAWKDVKDRPEPPRETVWIDTFLVEDAWRRAQKSEVPCIIWYEHLAIEQALAKLSGLKPYGAGTDSSPTRDQVLLASIGAQGTGMNLQYHYAHNIITSLPPNGATVEQLLARTHRPGQIHDEVTVDIYGHTPESRSALDAVLEDAKFEEETGEGRKRVLSASRIDW